MERHEFQPKEWVLVRDDDVEKWKLDIFSHLVDGTSFPYICVGSHYDECLPYAGNEALLGTTDAPAEWKVGDKVEVQYCCDDKWYAGVIVEVDPSHTTFGGKEYPYKVAASCFHDSFKSSRWCSKEQLREPIENEEWRPKEGEFVEVLHEGEWKSGKVLEDDHSSVPFYVRIEDGETRWFTECKVRPAKKKEKDEPFKYGDKVEVNFAGDWREAVIVQIDSSSIPYKVATPDGDIHWCIKSRVRRA